MRPTTSNMLQQNNNNNYPCLNVSGSTREMLQKCSRASLPFPSRLELGLGDLPLIRGLRAWALCSKNRRKAGGMLGGGQAPTAPPAGHWGSTSCPRPADVYLSGEWGRMGYGLPLGLDARQAGIGALVTVATLKTSEGSGKTQTQCLFLRTEKGSCLYSTAKPSSGVTSSAGSSGVGGWLRGKTGGGGGGRDIPAGRRDNGQTLPSHNGVNRVRVRSGRRWRKSSNAAAREKTGVSRERQQSSREDPAEEITLEERQEERDKGGLASKLFPSPQQDSRRARQEKEGACRSPRCCHSASPKTCTQCGGRAQRRGSQDEHEGGESPRRGTQNRLNSEEKGMKRERQKNEEEEKGGLCALESSDSVLAVPNPDLESNLFQPESLSSCHVEEIKDAKSNEELKTQTSHSKDKYSKTEQDTDSEVMKIHTGNSGLTHGPFGQITDDLTSRHDRDFELPCEEVEACMNGFSDHVPADQESEKQMESVDVEEEKGSINQTPAKFPVVSDCYEDISVSTCPASISAAVSPEPTAPVEGSTCDADHEPCGVRTEQENSREDRLEGYHHGVADPEIMSKNELDVSRLEQQEPTCVAEKNKKEKPQFFFKNLENSSELEARQASFSPLRHGDPPVFETDRRMVAENGCNYGTTELKGAEQRDELVWENREEDSEKENIEERVNPEEGDDAWKRECNCYKLDEGDGKGDDDKERHTEDDINDSTTQEDNDEEIKRNCALKDNWRLEESTDGCRGREEEDRDTYGQTSITHVEGNGEASPNVACGDPSTFLALSLANPAPSLPPMGSMATGLPWLEAENEEKEEEEEEEEGVGVPSGERKEGQQGKRRLGRQLKEQGEEERGSTVATEEGRREEEEEEDEFGVFMQAEGEPAWSEGYTMSASVPCGSRESVALGNHAITREPTHWTPGWMDSSFHQSDDTWTAFPQNSSDEGRDMVGRWWPTSAVEESRDRLSTNKNLASVFAEAFPSLPGSSSSDPCDLDTVPTLTQLLRGKASQDQGLLDSFHDLNKMICQRYKRADGVSRDLLLRTLHLEQPHTESRPAPWTANRRLSPGLPSANQHAQNAAAKRRLSYDYNRNIME